MRIAHISDLHMRHHLPGTSEIALRRSREMPERFAEAIERISAEQPDLLVVSGDLLDYPLDDMDDPLTMAQGEADLRLLAEILARISCSMALVPGNHDHPVLMQRVFGHLPADQVVAGHRVFTFDDNEGADHVPERVGRSHRRFVDALHSDDGLPQIHVQHYVVWPPLNEDVPPHLWRRGRDARPDCGKRASAIGNPRPLPLGRAALCGGGNLFRRDTRLYRSATPIRDL